MVVRVRHAVAWWRGGGCGARADGCGPTLEREEVLRLFHVFTLHRVAERLALVPSGIHRVHPVIVDARVESTAHRVVGLRLRLRHLLGVFRDLVWRHGKASQFGDSPVVCLLVLL